MIALGLLFGFVVLGPLACWVLGLFNPIGYMGVPPWRVPPEALEVCQKHGHRNCFCRRWTS